MIFANGKYYDIPQVFRQTNPAHIGRLRMRWNKLVPDRTKAHGTFIEPTSIADLMNRDDWEWCVDPEIDGLDNSSVVFRANIGGNVDVISLDTQVPRDTVLVLRERSKGMFSALCHSTQVFPARYSSLVLGPDDHGMDVVLTFCPGDPIKATVLESTAVEELRGLKNGSEISRHDAYVIGFDYVQVKHPAER